MHKSPLLQKAEAGIGIRQENQECLEKQEERLPVKEIMTYMEMIVERLERKGILLQNGELEQLVKLAERIMGLASSNKDAIPQTPHT